MWTVRNAGKLFLHRAGVHVTSSCRATLIVPEKAAVSWPQSTGLTKRAGVFSSSTVDPCSATIFSLNADLHLNHHWAWQVSSAVKYKRTATLPASAAIEAFAGLNKLNMAHQQTFRQVYLRLTRYGRPNDCRLFNIARGSSPFKPTPLSPKPSPHPPPAAPTPAGSPHSPAP